MNSNSLRPEVLASARRLRPEYQALSASEFLGLINQFVETWPQTRRYLDYDRFTDAQVQQLWEMYFSGYWMRVQEQSQRAAAHETEEWIEWVEPHDLTVSSHAQVVRMRASELAANRRAQEPRYTSDEQAIEDFICVYWARRIQLPVEEHATST